MSESNLSLEAPISHQLLQIDRKQAGKSELMPGHWDLYEDILTKAGENDLVNGSEIPGGDSPLLRDLLSHQILIPAPLTYKQWLKNKDELRAAAADDEKRKADLEVSEILSESSQSGAAKEVDLDFLD